MEEDYRQNGKKALNIYLKNLNNIKILEQYAWNLCKEDQDIYNNIIMEINLSIHNKKNT